MNKRIVKNKGDTSDFNMKYHALGKTQIKAGQCFIQTFIYIKHTQRHDPVVERFLLKVMFVLYVSHCN